MGNTGAAAAMVHGQRARNGTTDRTGLLAYTVCIALVRETIRCPWACLDWTIKVYILKAAAFFFSGPKTTRKPVGRKEELGHRWRWNFYGSKNFTVVNKPRKKKDRVVVVPSLIILVFTKLFILKKYLYVIINSGTLSCKNVSLFDSE